MPPQSSSINRRLGLEQEVFVVEPNGESSQRADDLVNRCRELAPDHGLSEHNFATEWVKNVIELNTPAADSPGELFNAYGRILRVLLDAAADIGVRMYPYSVYPNHLIPVMRDEARYHVQVRTVGHERFLNAGKCTGVHMHLEVPHGTIHSQIGVAYSSTPEARDELLNIYNLATALDPVMIAISRACPFYEGQSSGLAHRTTRYRGSLDYGWEGVYTDLPEVGSLRPYAATIEDLVKMQFERHHSWLTALRTARVDQKQMEESGLNLLNSSWNPVRLNRHGTVELRNLDSNLPKIILGLVMLVRSVQQRVLDEGLQVVPEEGLETMQIDGKRLLVPDFELLQHKLLFASVTEGIKRPAVAKYVNSVLQVAGADPQDPLGGLVPNLDTFETTEEVLLQRYYPRGEMLSREKGLELVREACDEFETEVAELEQSEVSRG